MIGIETGARGAPARMHPPRRRATGTLRTLGTVLGMTSLLAACGLRPDRPSVLLVTIDTLRADHLGCYGNDRAATPHLDALAARGARFTQVTATVPLTLPSHASLMTGLYPYQHGVRENLGFALPPRARTLAERLRDAGYQTAAFVSAFPVGSTTGIQQGFETYRDPVTGLPDDPAALESVERDAAGVTEDAIAWLAAAGPEPFFLWVHCYDPHSPYAPPADLAARFHDSPYDGEIAHVDRCLGPLFERVRLLGRTNLMTIVTADHGEGLGDHGQQWHAVLVYETTQRVPLILEWPAGGVAPQVIDSPVSGVDLLPTVLEACGLPAEDSLPGRSLLPAMREGSPLPDVPVYAESLSGWINYGWAPLRSIRRGRWKWIQAPTPELYDLVADPGESRNLAASRPEVSASLQADLEAMLPAEESMARAEASTQDLAALAQLGYVGTLSPEGSSAQAPRDLKGMMDPKDSIDLHNRMKLTNEQVAFGKLPQALQTIEGVLAEDPRNMIALRQKSLIQRRLGRPEEALATIDRALAIRPHEAMLHHTRAINLIALGRGDEGIEEFRTAVEIDPAYWQAWLKLGETLVQVRHDLEGGLDAWLHAAGINPRFPSLLHNIGALLARLGRPEEGIAWLGRAVDLVPRGSQNWITMGHVARQAGRDDLVRKSRDTLVELIDDLARRGARRDARELLEEARGIDPSWKGWDAAAARLEGTVP